MNNAIPEKQIRNDFFFSLLLSTDNEPLGFESFWTKYTEQDAMLLELISYEYTDKEIVDIVGKYTYYCLLRYKEKEKLDIFESAKVLSLQKQKAMLECEKLNDWIDLYFISWLKYVPNIQFVSKDIRGLCFTYYDYQCYLYKIKSVYNSDTSYLETVYKDIFDKGSSWLKHHLIPIDFDCELLAIEPPRIYDKKINKTIYSSNVPKELAEIFNLLKAKKLCDDISIRCSNIPSHIFEGRNELQTLMEATEFGCPFSTISLGTIPVSKFYSKDYADSLWVKVDFENITFEELCKIENKFENMIITQVIHLKFKIIDAKPIITHIDHEYVFYTKEEYENRKYDSSIKGTAKKRLKSFKIDNATIPFDFRCSRTININNPLSDEVKQLKEDIPFLLLVLKIYFKHKDLIDEYFVNLQI